MIENESAENYLETILMLSKKLPVVRSVDIANELGFKKSSVSIAMKNLREKKHITVTDAGFIYLTESGQKIADMVYERHEFLSEWLTNLVFHPKLQLKMPAKLNISLAKKVMMQSRPLLQIILKTCNVNRHYAFLFHRESCLHHQKHCQANNFLLYGCWYAHDFLVLLS